MHSAQRWCHALEFLYIVLRWIIPTITGKETDRPTDPGDGDDWVESAKSRYKPMEKENITDCLVMYSTVKGVCPLIMVAAYYSTVVIDVKSFHQ